MNISIFIILPITGAILGWITNLIAIKMLFYPRKKTLGIQGILPKRKKILSKKISEASFFILPEKIEKLTKTRFIGEKISNYIKKGIEKKIDSLSDKEIQKIIENVVKKEFRFIELTGLVIGAIIGLLQAIIISI